MCMYAWVTCVQHATFFSFYLICKAYETDTILKVALLLLLLLLLILLSLLSLLPFMQSL